MDGCCWVNKADGLVEGSAVRSMRRWRDTRIGDAKEEDDSGGGDLDDEGKDKPGGSTGAAVPATAPTLGSN